MNTRMYSLVALAVLLGGSVFSYARMGTSDTRLIPYSGTLRSANVPANGVYEMRFGLFTNLAADARPACLDTDPTTCTPWGEQQTVRVSAGEFAVALGESNAIADSDISSNALYLAMAVKGPSDPDFVHIGNHEIIPVPWAARAATSTEYEVTGNLSVGGVIEMGDRIDFHTGVNADYDARFHATGQDTMQLAGANLTVVPGAGPGTGSGNIHAAGLLSTDGRMAINSAASNKLTLSGSSDVDIHYDGSQAWQAGTNWGGATGGANSFYWYTGGGQKMSLSSSGRLTLGDGLNLPTCQWKALQTHDTVSCDAGEVMTGICMTNKLQGCTGINGTVTAGGDSEYGSAGAIKCCK